jgi:hypothetical protein
VAAARLCAGLLGAAWDLRQTADNTLSYQLGTNGRQGWSAPTAKIDFVDAEPTPSRFPADRRSDQDVVGSHLVPTFFSLRPRVAPHFTSQIGSRNMTSVSSSSSTELGYGVSALEPAEPRETTEHPLALRYLVQAARQLRPAARPLRTASAVAGQ